MDDVFDFKIGQVVISKAGRDKGFAFVITAIEQEYLYLVDGKTRPLENPKKKKARHVQPTKTVAMPDLTANRQFLKNADFKAALKRFRACSH